MQRIEVNVLTGEQTIVDLTAEEIAYAQAQNAKWQAAQASLVVGKTLEQIAQEQQALITTLTERITALESKA